MTQSVPMVRLDPMPDLIRMTVFELANRYKSEFLGAAHCQHEPRRMRDERDARVKAYQDEAARRGVDLYVNGEARPGVKSIYDLLARSE
jgi:hypothetical protein